MKDYGTYLNSKIANNSNIFFQVLAPTWFNVLVFFIFTLKHAMLEEYWAHTLFWK